MQLNVRTQLPIYWTHGIRNDKNLNTVMTCMESSKRNSLLSLIFIVNCFSKTYDNKWAWSLEKDVAISSQPPSGRKVGGGGVIPLYKLYRHVPPHRVGFLCRFGLKTGIHFAPPPLLPWASDKIVNVQYPICDFGLRQIKIPLFHSNRAQNEEPTR